MKRRISDMLSGYTDSSVELNTLTPLSSERIKELTMSKIERKPKRKGRGIFFKILVAAATISMLTMTAAAAEEIFGAGDFFRGILNRQLQEDQAYVEEYDLDVTVRETISQGQYEVINELGKVFTEQTYTCDGTTMTLSAAYADANIMHLYLKAEAPEGTVLPDGIIYEFYDYTSENWNVLELPEDAPYEMGGHSIDIEALPDEDPTDNKKDFHVTIKLQSGMEMKMNDGIAKFYNITGIYEQVVDVNGDEDGYEIIAPGNFQFDIGLANDYKVVELDVAGLTYGGDTSRTWTCGFEEHGAFCEGLETDRKEHTEYWNYSVTVKSLKLSPLSADWAIDYTCSNERMSCNLAFQVVMKDGTSPRTLPDFGGGDGGSYSFGTALFATPIDLDEIDYILIGDPDINSTHKIYLPE